MINNALLLLAFIVNYFVLIPRLYFNKRYFTYGCYIVVSFLIICLLPSLITGRIPWRPGGIQFPRPPHNGPEPPTSYLFYFVQEIRHCIYLFVTVILFSILLRVRGRMYSLEKDKMNAALSSLKAQINPHFLFNTLNSLYALAVKRDEKMSGAVINLAGLMRYILKEATVEKIALQKEIDYITNYIELQQTRLRDTAAIIFQKPDTSEELEITPLILITFIENAFKYGVNPEEESEIVIAIAVSDGELTLDVSNKKVITHKPEISMGIGLENTRQRLDLLYPGRHHLDIRENEHTYSVHLSMLLT